MLENVHAQKPNVIIIMADDLDSRQLSCYGGKNIKTNNIDALAAEGMKFNQMIASETMCVPTRASLFTGLYPMRHGSFQNHKSVYNDSLKSVCHYMGSLGYTVALTGKNHSTKPESVFPFKILKGFEPNCVAPTDDYELDDVKKFIT
jgi:arylsulfatase A-like enzyme